MARQLFDLPPRSTRAGDSSLVKKAGKIHERPTIRVNGGGNALITRIQTIVATVNNKLGHKADDYLLIRDKDVLIDYFDHIVANKYASVDSETDGLNAMMCTLAGVCLYTHGMKPAYAPMHHVSYVTGVEADNQIPDEVMIEQLNRIKQGEGIYLDFFNGKFDRRVLKHTLGVTLQPSWDGYIGMRLLNENEPSNRLKNLWTKYCSDGQGDGFTYDNLFDGLPFTLIPIKSAYLYAAGDPVKTYELNEFQRKILDETTQECKDSDLTGISFLMKEVEVPLIEVVSDMQDVGVGYDAQYQQNLSKKYHKLQEEAINHVYNIISMYSDEIGAYRALHPEIKLDDPINLNSPKQLSVLLYDIMRIPKPTEKRGKGKSSGGTGEEVLSRIDHDIAKAILKYRSIEKLLGTYIDKMPKMVNPNTGKIHCNFNQVGTDTGRFSSDDPRRDWGLVA